MKDVISVDSNSKSEDTKYNNKPSNYTLELESKISPEPSQDSPLGQVTSLDKLADDIEAMICDWNAPRQLTGSVREAAEKMAKWHKAEVANLLQVIEDEVIGEMETEQVDELEHARNVLRTVQLEILKKLEDTVINGGSL